MHVEITNSFTVPADIDTAWATLLNVEAITPCMPGASLESVDGDLFVVNVKVKLGPVQMNYRGNARFIEKDAELHTAVIDGSANETRGGGGAKATIRTTLETVDGTTTRVDVHTDLAITGKAAQFGRGVIQDVASRLTEQFAHNLELLITGSNNRGSNTDAVAAAEQSAHASSPSATSTQAVSTPAAVPIASEPLDLLQSARGAILKRLVPVLIGALLIGAVIWLLASH